MTTRSRHKEFDVEDDDTLEPLSFTLKYTNGEKTEPFYCMPEIPGKLLLDLMAPAARADDERSGLMMAVATLDFFPKVMKEEEWERLAEALDNKERPVRTEKLSEIVSWLMEEYSERPTEQSSD